MNMLRGRRFLVEYECYPVSMLREDVERGGKIIMPSSALEELTQLNITYPMMFRLKNGSSGRTSHCGVLEFVADEGRVYLPRWMMKNLALNECDTVTVECVDLPTATYAKFQPMSTDFLDISDSKAVLENTLRNFACLTRGDCIAIYYNKRVYEVCVLETRPGDAVCIIECDMSVEYVAPVDYVDPVSTHSDHELDSREFVPFSGQGHVLVQKKKKKKSVTGESVSPPVSTARRGVPDYSYTVGVLQFFRNKAAEENRHKETQVPHTQLFPGPGYSLS